jgi:hypothetical protein
MTAKPNSDQDPHGTALIWLLYSDPNSKQSELLDTAVVDRTHQNCAPENYFVEDISYYTAKCTTCKLHMLYHNLKGAGRPARLDRLRDT